VSSIRSRLALGSLWITLGRATGNLLSFAGTLLLARLLVPADFGLIAIATAILAMLNAVTNIPLGAALIRHENPTSSHLDTAWTLSVMRGVLLALAMVGLGWLTASLYNDQRLLLVMSALALAPFIDGLRNPRSILLTRDLVFRQQVLLQILEKLVLVAVSVFVAVMYQSYWALVAGPVAGKLAATAASYFVLTYRPKFSLQWWREYYNFSTWVTLSQIINEINWRFDQLLVGRFLGQTALGYYRVGSDLAQMPTREITAPLTGTLFPAFANLRHDAARLSLAYSRAQAMTAAVALPAGVGVALIAEPLVLFTMTEKWAPAIPVIQALASIFAVQTLGSLATPLAMALGETKLLFKRDLQMFLIRVPIVIAGMLLYGLPGVIWGRVVSGLISIPFNLGIVRQLIGTALSRQLRQAIRSLISAAIMAAGVAVVNRNWNSIGAPDDYLLNIVAAVVCGGSLYIASHWTLWIMAGRPDGPESELIKVAKTLSVRRSAIITQQPPKE
jgi:lipopolysaccharide exporter